MGIKIKRKRKRSRNKSRRESAPLIREVGEGTHIVSTMNRHDGSIVLHRFRTAEEAQAQYLRNIALDLPLVTEEQVA